MQATKVRGQKKGVMRSNSLKGCREEDEGRQDGGMKGGKMKLLRTK